MPKQADQHDEKNDAVEAPVGKGRPTPKRRQQEQANLRPLVPNDRKEARQREREAREKVRERMLAGDERYLMARDKGPQRAFVRRYVDARTTLSEYLIPVMVLILVTSMIQNAYAILFSTLAMYLFILIVGVELVILNFQVKRRIDAKYGADRREKGLGLYAAMRAIQFRRFRAPKPQNSRGDYPS